jgi:hypothetical protein
MKKIRPLCLTTEETPPRGRQPLAAVGGCIGGGHCPHAETRTETVENFLQPPGGAAGGCLRLRVVMERDA